MRRMLIGLVVAAATVMIPTWALASNQEVAEQIAANLRESGRLQDYNIGVKYQDGTAWLRGRVRSEEQLDAALTVVFETAGVNRVVNDVTVDTTGGTATADGPQLMLTGGALEPEQVFPGAAPAAPAPVNPNYAARRLQQVTRNPAPAQQAATNGHQGSPIPQARAPQPAGQSVQAIPRSGRPMPVAYTTGQPVQAQHVVPGYVPPMAAGGAPARYDQPYMPKHAWPSYAAYPNYAALSYPKQYSPMAWPYIGPFYPYPQVPLGWRKVTLEWDNGWWFLDFKD